MSGYYDRDRTLAAPTMHHPSAHLNATGEYLVSGWPGIVEVSDQSGDTFDILLDHVTQWVVVSAQTAPCTVYFADPDVYTTAPGFVVPTGTISPRLDCKVTKIYVVTDGGTATVMLGLTSVTAEKMPSMVTWEGVGVPVDSNQYPKQA